MKPIKKLTQDWIRVSSCTPSVRFVVLLLTSLLGIVPFNTRSQDINLNFSKIPLSDPEINSSGRGALYWNAVPWDNIKAPQIPGGTTKGYNCYRRFSWFTMEKEMGVYTFTGPYPSFEFWIRYSIDRGETFGFGVMTICEGCDVALDGGRGAYPLYLHNLMQAEDVNSRDWKTSYGLWIPNWNSPNYLSRYEALMNALSNFIKNGTYVAQGGPNKGKTVRYRDVIDYVDIRGFGNFGEWHNYPYHNQQPTGRVATSASLKKIIDIHKNAFPDNQLILVNGAFEDGPASYIPLDVTYYALTTSNNFGRLGWRRDNLGEKGEDQRLSQNPSVYNGYRFDTAIVNRWKYAMVTGEPINGGGQYANGGPAYYDLRREINLYHLAHFGNGNYPYSDVSNPAMRDTIHEAFKLTGYRYYLDGGTVKSPLIPGLPFTVSLKWQNKGVAPIYEKHWRINYELRNAQNTTVWSGTSYFNPYLFLPGDSTVTDQFTLPANIATGNYSLRMVIRDSTGYRLPLQLAIYGRDTDGSYLLTNIAVGTAVPNNPPAANAGSDQVITLPVNSTTITGTATDSDGSIASTSWVKISGPQGGALQNASSLSTLVTGLTEGVYFFQLNVLDNLGTPARDTLKITVLPDPNQKPVANAGADQVITLPVNNTTLSGLGTDSDGTITSYAWSKVSGPQGESIASPASASTVVSGLKEGIYLFQLTVQDNAGAVARDTLKVTLLPAPNIKPVVDAGPDQVITLPVNSLTLTGSATDSDGTISSYVWFKLSGPQGGILQSPATAVTAVSDMTEGTYYFQLTVKDNSGDTVKDTVKVTVLPDPNIKPVARAGEDILLISPEDSTRLDGSLSSDADGNIVSFLWRKVSGPDQFTLDNTGNASPKLSRLSLGAYTFSLEVTDNNGAKAWDTVAVVYKLPDAPPNQAPVANAGNDGLLTLPLNTDTLDASASGDPDGFLVSYRWTKISGPADFLIENANAAVTRITGLTEGTYYFQVEVADNYGLTDRDTVMIKVNPAPNQPPVAYAGNDLSVNLPNPTIQLNGSASSDPDGTIAAYSWVWVSGPGSVTIDNPAAVKANVSGVQQGVYVFELTVTDNRGATAKDQVTVTVNPAPNRPPVANAGADITVFLPVQTVQLNGAASYDPDGNTLAYSWVKVAGPGNISITNPASANTPVTGLQLGVYTFELTVTDKDGATAKDQVTVTVNPPLNKVPVAHAGADTVIAYPSIAGVLNGSRSYDPDGKIATVAWRQLDGPSTAWITDPRGLVTEMKKLELGDYRFELQVTDDQGARSRDTVGVSVQNLQRSMEFLSVFPNPATRFINYNYAGSVTGIATLSVYDLSGNRLISLTQRNDQGNFTGSIAIDRLKPGLYIFEIMIENKKRLISKFIRQ